MPIPRGCHFKRVAYVILALYFVVSILTGYKLLLRNIVQNRQRLVKNDKISDQDDWNPWGEPFDLNPAPNDPKKPLWQWEKWDVEEAKVNPATVDSGKVYDVEIWGKAAIGLYLWLHILNGELEQRFNGVWSYGMKEINNIKFRYRTGPGVIPSKVPRDTENLVLVLNGMEPAKVDFSKLWLDHLTTMKTLKNVAVVLLGNEACDNSWIKPYMMSNGGLVKMVFIVYDTLDVDEWEFYQWPLGVATYRDFPRVDSAQLPLDTPRRFTCNYMATIYKNSSREQLLRYLDLPSNKNACYVKARHTWQEQESADSLNDYIRTLSQSDLTFNPVGKNTECYRIYEAMSYGSIPVIEDIRTPGKCDLEPDKISNEKISRNSVNLFKSGGTLTYNNGNGNNHGPLRLLKKYHAPVIYVKNWKEVEGILRQEKLMSSGDKVERRRDVVAWYESFKGKMRDKFVSVILERFFNVKLPPR